MQYQKTIVLVILQFCCSISFSQSLDPGMWKVKTVFKLDGIPLPTKDDQECISSAEARDAKATVSKELKRNDCRILSWKVSGQKLAATIKCETSEIQAEGTLNGQFTAKNYHLTGAAKGTYQGFIPSLATLQLDGNWVGACKSKAPSL